MFFPCFSFKFSFFTFHMSDNLSILYFLPYFFCLCFKFSSFPFQIFYQTNIYSLFFLLLLYIFFPFKTRDNFKSSVFSLTTFVFVFVSNFQIFHFFFISDHPLDRGETPTSAHAALKNVVDNLIDETQTNPFRQVSFI